MNDNSFLFALLANPAFQFVWPFFNEEEAEMPPNLAQARAAKVKNFWVWLVSMVTLAGIGYALFALFRPVIYEFRIVPQERALATDIVNRHSRHAMDFFKLWPDKSYFFSTSRRSFIAYRVGANYALAHRGAGWHHGICVCENHSRFEGQRVSTSQHDDGARKIIALTAIIQNSSEFFGRDWNGSTNPQIKPRHGRHAQTGFTMGQTRIRLSRRVRMPGLGFS